MIPKLSSTSLAIVITLFLVHAALGLHTIKKLSPTYDEHLHLAAGYSYWATGDYRLNAFDHPPLAEMWAALPLLSMKPMFPSHHPYWQEAWRYQYPFADLFMYKNKVDAEKMLHAGRRMILLLSLLLGVFIFLWARDLFGEYSALCALFLWAFSSSFIAHGTLVTTDMALTVFYFSSAYFFWKWWRKIKMTNANASAQVVLASVSVGLLLASKYSAVVIFGVFGVVLAWYYYQKQVTPGTLIKNALVMLVVILAVLALVYRFNSLSVYYWLGLKKVFAGVASGRSSFLMGRYSTTGWVYYFPVVFLLKTPIPFLVLLLVSFLRPKLWSKEKSWFLLWPAVFYFALSCYAKVNIGHRHILPVYPFLTVWISGVFVPGGKRLYKAAGFLLLFWYAFACVKNHPWHVSFCNEFIGEPDNAYVFMTDSNVDWGQGLKALGAYVKKEKIGGIYLNYFGTGDPHYYGIRYVPAGFIDNLSDRGLRTGDGIDFTKEEKKIFAISATNLQATYYADKNVFSWLKTIPHETILARSLLIYDLSNHPEEYRKIAHLTDRKP